MCAACQQRSQQQLLLVCYCRYRAVHLSTSTTFDLSTCLYMYNRYIRIRVQSTWIGSSIYTTTHVCDRHSRLCSCLWNEEISQGECIRARTKFGCQIICIAYVHSRWSVPTEYTFLIHFCDEPFFRICISSFGFLGLFFIFVLFLQSYIIAVNLGDERSRGKQQAKMSPSDIWKSTRPSRADEKANVTDKSKRSPYCIITENRNKIQ